MNQPPDDETLRRILVDDHTLYALKLDAARISGQPKTGGNTGQPVIMLHGVTGSFQAWNGPQAKPFLEQGPCYSLSLPGHYPAVFPPKFRKEQLTANTIAHLLADAIRQLVGEHRVTLVGHSTGGFAALAIAAYAPEIVQRIVCLSGFAQGRWIGTFGSLQALARSGPFGRLIFDLPFRLGQASKKVFAFLWRSGAANTQAMDAYLQNQELVEAGYQNFKHLHLGGMAAYFSVMPGIDISDSLATIQAPTLVLAGDHDSVVPPAQAQLIGQRIPNASLAIFQGGGHVLYAECPQEYQQTLSEWLQKTR